MRDTGGKRIFAFITNRCTNACKYCFVYDGRRIEDMSIEQFDKLCRQGIKDYSYITFIGGEPLLHPDLLTLMKIAIDYGYKISISTSGISDYGEKTDAIFALPIDDVTISLDSHDEKTNDSQRCTGSYTRAIDTAKYLHKRNIPIRFTCTVCDANKNHILKLADLVYCLGAEQLDIHVMSKKGRASGNDAMELSPKEWLRIRRMLDETRFPSPFQISYPLMWYEDGELDCLQYYCDASTGQRLSVMSNCECYCCTIAIGFDDAKILLDESPVDNCPSLYSKSEGMCFAEQRILTKNDGLQYVCRFIKRRTRFIEEE